MKLPDPDTHCWDDDTQSDVWSYSKELVEHMLAERDAALKQALEALWTTATPKCEDAIKAIQEVLA
mgnify:CR=1 FL=1